MSDKLKDHSRARARRASRTQPTLIIGAGPAGLTAGYLLAKQGLPVIVFEAEDQVGGIAKTEVRDGPGGEYRFDLGGHRFFTKVKEVDDLWHEIMREEFLKRPRMSRIYWNKKFLDYPLRGPDVIKKLGPVELTARVLLLPLGADQARRAARTPSSSGSPTASASACSTSSSVLHREGVGRARPRRSAPSGPPSGSRACRSSAPPRPRSSATRATSRRSSASSTTRASARARCGRR